MWQLVLASASTKWQRVIRENARVLRLHWSKLTEACNLEDTKCVKWDLLTWSAESAWQHPPWPEIRAAERSAPDLPANKVAERSSDYVSMLPCCRSISSPGRNQIGLLSSDKIICVSPRRLTEVTLMATYLSFLAAIDQQWKHKGFGLEPHGKKYGLEHETRDGCSLSSWILLSCSADWDVCGANECLGWDWGGFPGLFCIPLHLDRR